MFVSIFLVITNLRIVLFSAFFFFSLFCSTVCALYFCYFSVNSLIRAHTHTHAARRCREKRRLRGTEKKRRITALLHCSHTGECDATEKRKETAQILVVLARNCVREERQCVCCRFLYEFFVLSRSLVCMVFFFFSVSFTREFRVDRAYVCYFVSHAAFIIRVLFRSARAHTHSLTHIKWTKHSFILSFLSFFFYRLFA